MIYNSNNNQDELTKVTAAAADFNSLLAQVQKYFPETGITNNQHPPASSLPVGLDAAA